MDHVLYEGDNLAVMSGLESRSVDTIYVDPPYNTRLSREFNDTFTHTEWVNFMRPRLVEARRLLKPSGIIFVSIGDRELARLRLLLDEVFSESNFLQMLIWQGRGYPGASFSRGGTDYILAYANSKARARPWKEVRPGTHEFLLFTKEAFLAAQASGASNPDRVAGVAMRSYARTHESWMRSYEFSVDGVPARPAPLTARSTRYPYSVTGPDGTEYEANWRLPRASFETLRENGEILWGGQYPRRLIRLTDAPTSAPAAVFQASGESPGKHIAKLLGYNAFENSKDYRVLMRWLDIATPRDGVILDCFSGSGSAFEAVLRLNANGSKRTIIGIERDFFLLAKSRIESVRTGVRPDGVRHSEAVGGIVRYVSTAGTRSVPNA